MALYMLMAKYSQAAQKSIFETGSDREAASRAAIEAVGGKLLGFYGMLGQEYTVALIAEVPGTAEYIGALLPVIASGALESWKTIPLYSSPDFAKAMTIAKQVREVYKPPGR